MMRCIATLGALIGLFSISGCPDSAPTNDQPPPSTTTACVEAPTDVPRPPGATLPCELLPPGYKP